MVDVILLVARLLPVLRHRRVSPPLRRRQADALAGTAVRAQAHVLLARLQYGLGGGVASAMTPTPMAVVAPAAPLGSIGGRAALPSR